VETGGNAAGDPDVRSCPERGCGGEKVGTGVGVPVGGVVEPPLLPPPVF